MAKNGSIIKSVYNSAPEELDYLFESQGLLAQLHSDRDHLKSWTTILQNVDHFLPASQSQSANPAQIDVGWDFNHFIPVEKYSFLKPGSKAFWTNLILVDGQHRIRSKYPKPFYAAKYTGRKERIQSINEELRKLRLELQKTPNKELFLKLRKLVQELHSIISFFYAEQRKLVRNQRKSYYVTLVRDIRRVYRQTVHFIFKNLPDFSGSEEEARFKTIVRFKSLILLNQKYHDISQRIIT